MRKLVIMATVFAISAATIATGCSNKKEATHPFVTSSKESSCSRKDDPVNNGGAQRGGGSKVVGTDGMESSCSRKDDPVNKDSAKRGGGSKVVESKDETSLCICGKEDLVNDDSSTKSVEQTVQVNTPDTAAMQSVSTDTSDVLAKVPDYVRNYLTPTNDPNKNNPQYYIDFGRFLRDHGATGIIGLGFYSGEQSFAVCFRNGIIALFTFGERIPYTMDYNWSKVSISAYGTKFASTEEFWYYFFQSGEECSTWDKDFDTIFDRSFNYDYKEYFTINPDEEFFKGLYGSIEKDVNFGDYHLNVHASFFETFEKVIEPYISLTDYSLNSDPLPSIKSNY